LKFKILHPYNRLIYQ